MVQMEPYPVRGKVIGSQDPTWAANFSQSLTVVYPPLHRTRGWDTQYTLTTEDISLH